MSSELQMVDTPARRRTSKGTIYEAKFYFEGSDPDALMPKIGDTNVDWVTFKPNRVVDSKADPLGTSAFMVYVSVTTESEDGAASGNSKDELGKWVDKQMSLKEIVLQPKWWGIMVADKVIAGKTPFKSFDSKKNKDHQYDYYYAYKNISQTGIGDADKYCVEGDYVYKNANPRIKIIDTNKAKDPGDTGYETVNFYDLHKNPDDGTFTESVGTPNLKLSPYTGLTADNASYAGQKLKVMVYKVTYYVYKKFDLIPMFAGINGTFGPGCSPFETTAATWLAIDQTVDRVKDNDGSVWSKITRTMERVPGPANTTIRWDIAKMQYGTWTW